MTTGQGSSGVDVGADAPAVDMPVKAVLTMTRGLPASGKSTWACEQVLAAAALTTIRVNKDLLREMLHAGRHQKGSEALVLAARDALVSRYLAAGVNVIVDDTNLNPVHERQLRMLAAKNGATFAVREFTDVDVDECVRRDALRVNPVGEKVIRDSHRRWLASTAQTSTQMTESSHAFSDTDSNGSITFTGQVREAPVVVGLVDAPSAVIVDVDGTVALMHDRSPYEWHAVGQDRPNAAVIEVVRSLHAAGQQIVFLSGRDSSCFEATERWLVDQVKVPFELFMRAVGDNRKDSIVKRELFDAHVDGRFNVLAVIDDRDQVVRMWRDELGLTCLQVADGAF